ncbi:MAG: tetratricopeptide repeat protein, partial [Calditrichaeota bacterium]|nr:tetratricopeptide repeat protein [Calditrichota bacterium]
MIPRTHIISKILTVVLLASLFYYCGEDSSTDIPTTFTNVTDELAAGWTAYMEGDYSSAESHFITVAERDAEVADAYNGLAWTYMRGKDFPNAISQFSFVVSLSDLQGNDVIKADAYAGMFLLNYIRKVDGTL